MNIHPSMPMCTTTEYWNVWWALTPRAMAQRCWGYEPGEATSWSPVHARRLRPETRELSHALSTRVTAVTRSSGLWVTLQTGATGDQLCLTLSNKTAQSSVATWNNILSNLKFFLMRLLLSNWPLSTDEFSSRGVLESLIETSRYLVFWKRS